MRIKIWLITIFVLCNMAGFANKNRDTAINGYVINKTTQEHLPFMTVALKGTTIGTVTDASGRFILKNLPAGEFTITVSGVGYKSSEQMIDLTPGSSVDLKFEIEEDQILLESVVVSANRNETNRREAPVIVNIISPKLLENTNSVCLAQGLSFQPGLRVETNCQNCGFQQVRINGMEGQYSQILIDSRPIFSALAGVYGIEQIPANMIERVEVTRGGSSALFGSNAIAGTINIITREPNSNSITAANTTNLIYGAKADINTLLNASVVSGDFKSGVMIFGSTRQRSPFDYDKDGFTEIGKINVKNIGFRGYYNTGNYSKLTFEYHNLGEFRRGGNNLDLPPHQADITEQIEHNINTGGLKYDMFSGDGKHRLNLYSSAQRINRESYYGAQKNPNAYGSTRDISFVAGTQYTYTMERLLFMPSVLTAGAEYSFNELNDKMLGYNRTIDQSVNTKSAFFQNEWKNKKLSLLFGGRLDKHNLIKEPIISPRFNFRYTANEHVGLRASYSSGFRAPQAFDEDLHITAVGGNVSLIRLDPNLKTEKSKSYSASADLFREFGEVKTNLLLEGFYNDLDNVFLLQEIGTDADGNLILERRNGSGAIVKGINVEGQIIFSKDFLFQTGLTVQRSEYKKNQVWSNNTNLIPHRKMFRTPDRYGYITAAWQPAGKLNVAISGIYTGSMLIQHFAGYIAEDAEKKTPEFYDTAVKFSCDFPFGEQLTLQLNTGVQNVFNSYQDDFDKGEFRDAGYVYGPSLPRTFFMGLKLSL